MAELLIKGGMVIDGTGNAGYEADVFVKDGKIAKIVKIAKNEKNKTDPSDFAAAAVQVLDARGKLVTPGFINMHSHSDCSVAMYPEMESTLGQGITTEFAGHCGLGVAPVDKYWLYMFPEKRAFSRVIPEPIGGINPYDAYVVPTDCLRKPFEEAYGETLDWSTYGEFIDHMRKRGMGANLVLVAGHAQMRLQAMGLDYMRDATKEELQAMEASLNDAMDHGAIGLSLGLDYEPGMFAGEEGWHRDSPHQKQRSCLLRSFPEFPGWSEGIHRAGQKEWSQNPCEPYPERISYGTRRR